MGVDISVIIAHNLSIDEVLDLPSKINSWLDVRQFADEFHHKIGRIHVDPNDAECAFWDVEVDEMNPEIIAHVWDYWASTEDDTNFPEVMVLNITTAFGWLKVNRKTVCICPYEHKFANLLVEEMREYLFEIMRLIARHLDSNSILYAPDSAFPQEYLEEMSFMGYSLEEIIAEGNRRFGKPNKVFDPENHGYYFIDEIEA